MWASPIEATCRMNGLYSPVRQSPTAFEYGSSLTFRSSTFCSKVSVLNNSSNLKETRSRDRLGGVVQGTLENKAEFSKKTSDNQVHGTRLYYIFVLQARYSYISLVVHTPLCSGLGLSRTSLRNPIASSCSTSGTSCNLTSSWPSDDDILKFLADVTWM